MAAQQAFALTPGQANQGILNWTTVQGRDIYKLATAGLYPNDDPKYDGTADNLSTFMSYVKERSIDFGWSDEEGILSIVLNPVAVAGGAEADCSNLLDNYGQITMDQVRAHVQVYVQTPTRLAQDSNMLYKALVNSLDKEAYNKVRMKSSEYTVEGYLSGELLLRTIIREAHTDTNATLKMIFVKIRLLPEYLTKFKGDISKFNLYVEGLIKSLEKQGATSTELLGTLFTSYQESIQDQVFVRYIETIENNHDSGQEITTRDLMNRAFTKYQTRVDSGKWNAPTPEQEQILALKAELKQLKTKPKPTKEKSKRKKQDKRMPREKGKKKKQQSKPTPGCLYRQQKRKRKMEARKR